MKLTPCLLGKNSLPWAGGGKKLIVNYDFVSPHNVSPVKLNEHLHEMRLSVETYGTQLEREHREEERSVVTSNAWLFFPLVFEELLTEQSSISTAKVAWLGYIVSLA